MTLTIELAGLEVFGHHGAEDEERERGQRFLFDVWADVSGPTASDRLEDTVDYRELAACVREVSDRRRFHLLETLASTLADALLERFELERVRVRVRKPDVELELPVDYAAVSVERTAD
jgi:dihydroneopterin aldolase